MIFVWPWNENVRIKQKEQTNTNRVIWSAYQSDTNAHGFWLVKWTLWWKNFLSKDFLVSIDTSLWHHTATQLANQTMPSLYDDDDDDDHNPDQVANIISMTSFPMYEIFWRGLWKFFLRRWLYWHPLIFGYFWEVFPFFWRGKEKMVSFWWGGRNVSILLVYFS